MAKEPDPITKTIKAKDSSYQELFQKLLDVEEPIALAVEYRRDIENLAAEKDARYVDVVTTLLSSLSHNLLRLSMEHYEEAQRLEKLSLLTKFIGTICLAVIVLISGAILDLGYLPSLESSRISIAALALIALIGQAVDYVFRFENQAINNKRFGNEIANFRRKVERYAAQGKLDPYTVHSLNRSYNGYVRTASLMKK